MNRKKLQIEQLDRKLKALAPLQLVVLPPTGWLKAVRGSLGMTLQQFADRLSITKQSAREIELRENEGSITLKSLKDAAQALDMKLVYALIPIDGSIDELIERKARALAEKIVDRTSNSMKLEDQENSKAFLKKAVDERTAALKSEMPKILWD